ncbi:MAG: Rossmann-like fold-containing protein [Cohaesibacteraceae bacterium]
MRSKLHRLRSELAYVRLEARLLELKHKLTEREPFDFVSAAKDGPSLFLGEGNLSFSLSIASRMGSTAAMLRATTYETPSNISDVAQHNAARLSKLGAAVLHGVDARRLEERFPATRFKLVVFQFPNVASRQPLQDRNPNHVLIRRFLRSARQVLASNGRVAITAIDSPHYDGAFSMHEAAAWAGLSPPRIYPFRMGDHQGYTHSNTQDENESALVKQVMTQTYVFDE